MAGRALAPQEAAEVDAAQVMDQRVGPVEEARAIKAQPVGELAVLPGGAPVLLVEQAGRERRFAVDGGVGGVEEREGRVLVQADQVEVEQEMVADEAH